MYKDYYAILGIKKTATQDEIKKAYRQLARTHHPDKNKGKPAAETKFKEINEAYAVLSDPEKRQAYDTYGTDRTPPPPPPGGWSNGGFNPGDFSDFFRDLFGAGGRGFEDMFRPKAPQNVEGIVNLTLEEAYRGTSKTVEIDGKKLEFKIPPGSRDGGKLRLAGQGPGGGNVILTLKIASGRFNISGDDVRSLVEVPAPLAVIGGKVKAQTLEGLGEISIPAGSQSGQVLRLKGLGFPKKTGGKGDLLLEIRITVPKNLTSEEKELYEKLAILLK